MFLLKNTRYLVNIEKSKKKILEGIQTFLNKKKKKIKSPGDIHSSCRLNVIGEYRSSTV
jgi:hypothetical protein